MSQPKQASKRKRRIKATPVLGVAGLFSLAGGVGVASAATGAPAADVPLQKITPTHEIMLGEEEVSDVSLATFYVIDKENAAAAQSGVKVAWRGCGRCGGCGGRGCGAVVAGAAADAAAGGVAPVAAAVAAGLGAFPGADATLADAGSPSLALK